MTFPRILLVFLAAALFALGCDDRPIVGAFGLGGDAGVLTGVGGTVTGGDAGSADAGHGDATDSDAAQDGG